MRLTDRTRELLTASGLTALVLVTRLPFVAHTLFEFDSVDFAVALHRFSLEQVTPHMPGYILHILLGKFLLLFTSNENSAFVCISVLLSIGSVLFLWRAAYWLRGGRVALIVALLWITNPLFWFYGEVATVYPHEAFYASAMLYFGISLLRRPQQYWRALAMALFLSLATGTRESSLIFFAPAILYLFVATRQPLRIWFWATFVFGIASLCWCIALLDYSGGLATYLHYASLEHIYRTQSILFGNPLREHLAVIGKIVVYLLVGCGCLIPLFLFGGIRFSRWLWQFTRVIARKKVFIYTALVAAAPLLFYVAVYFMKAGYLLNVLPSVILMGGVLLDQCAIWLARKKKERPGNRELLTRPIITRNVIILTSVLVTLNAVWFFAPMPGKSDETFRDEISRESFSATLATRYPGGAARRDAFLNKLFAYSAVQSVRAMDGVNDTLRRAIASNGSPENPAVLISTWWSRMAYFYLKSPVYDVETVPGKKLLVGESVGWMRTAIGDSLVRLPHARTVLLLIRSDHPDLLGLSRQVHLKHIVTPKYLDLYEITDSAFALTWSGVTFVKD